MSNVSSSAGKPGILARFKRVRSSGAGWTAQCPAHEDHNPSLSVHQRDGKLLIHCHRGCPPEKVVSAVGLTMADLFLDPRGHGVAAAT